MSVSFSTPHEVGDFLYPESSMLLGWIVLILHPIQALNQVWNLCSLRCTFHIYKLAKRIDTLEFLPLGLSLVFLRKKLLHCWKSSYAVKELIFDDCNYSKYTITRLPYYKIFTTPCSGSHVFLFPSGYRTLLQVCLALRFCRHP